MEEGSLDLKGKIAIVTGAGGGGQGRAVASRLAREDVSVWSAISTGMVENKLFR